MTKSGKTWLCGAQQELRLNENSKTEGTQLMVQLLGSESTTFTLDNMGRFLCNTLQEAVDSTAEIVGGRKRDFDVIVIGGGTVGSVIGQHLFFAVTTRSPRILVLV